MRGVAGLLVALAMAACGQGPTPAPAPKAADEVAHGSGSGAPGVESTVVCRLTIAEPQVETMELRSEDGNCRLLLPVNVAVGTLPVRVGAAPGEPVAAFEVRRGAEQFYASEGSVKVELAEGSGLRGSVEARDANPPGLARLSATFDLAAGRP